MPRPRRAKITRPARAPRVRDSINTSLVEAAPEKPFDDLYDVSDREDVEAPNLLHTKGDEGKVRPPSAHEKFPDNAKREQGPKEKNIHTQPAINRYDSEFSSSTSSGSPRTQVGGRERTTPKNRSKIHKHNQRPSSAASDSADSNSSKEINLAQDMSPDFGSVGLRRRGSRISGMAPSSINRLQYVSQLGNEYNDDEFSAVDVDASTPLNNSKSRKIDRSLPTSSTKKRKLSELQMPQSSPIVSSPVPSPLPDVDEIIPATHPLNDDQSEQECKSHTEDEESGIHMFKGHSTSADILSGVMAPPHSSSSIASSPVAPSKNLRSSRARTPQVVIDYRSDNSSPPSLTHSPDFPSAARVNSRLLAPLPSTFSTAQLQALLPRRRKRDTRDIFDPAAISEDEVDVSGLASDDDELSYLPVNGRTQRHRQEHIPPRRALAPHKKARGATHKKPAPSKTYGQGKNNPQDKENEARLETELRREPDDENASENSQELELRLGKELKMATRKFQEIDKWQLDFEEVSVPNLSSSSDAR